MTGPRPVLLACADFDDHRCGCGASEARFARSVTAPVEVVDPTNGTFRLLRRMWRARRTSESVVVVYPTRSVATSARAILALVIGGAVVRPEQRAVHLHEFAVFDELRIPWTALLLVRGGRIVVVSRTSDASAVRTSLRGRRMGVEVAVIPPVNGSAPDGEDQVVTPVPGLVGLFGGWRDERGVEPMLAALRKLPPRFHAIEAIGSGWSDVAWPDDVRRRFDIDVAGHLPLADVHRRIARWDVAVATFADGAHDGRMSLRTPLAFGVPTITNVREPSDLTLRPPHLLIDSPGVELVVPEADLGCRRHWAREIATFEADCAARLAVALVGGEVLSDDPSPS